MPKLRIYNGHAWGLVITEPLPKPSPLGSLAARRDVLGTLPAMARTLADSIVLEDGTCWRPSYGLPDDIEVPRIEDLEPCELISDPEQPPSAAGLTRFVAYATKDRSFWLGPCLQEIVEDIRIGDCATLELVKGFSIIGPKWYVQVSSNISLFDDSLVILLRGHDEAETRTFFDAHKAIYEGL